MNNITCPHCGGTFDADSPDAIGEYETTEVGDDYAVSIICPHCDEYVDIERPEPNE